MKKKIIITIIATVVVFISGVVVLKLHHVGDLARCTITTPTQEQIQVIENEFDINLSDNCTVTELFFMWDRNIWGWNNTWLTIQIEVTDPDVFLSNNIPFEITKRYTNHYVGLNQYDKEITFDVSGDRKTIQIKEIIVRNFSDCKEIFFGEGAEVFWI